MKMPPWLIGIDTVCGLLLNVTAALLLDQLLRLRVRVSSGRLGRGWAAIGVSMVSSQRRMVRYGHVESVFSLPLGIQDSIVDSAGTTLSRKAQGNSLFPRVGPISLAHPCALRHHLTMRWSEPLPNKPLTNKHLGN
jgi:hypothetical protein